MSRSEILEKLKETLELVLGNTDGLIISERSVLVDDLGLNSIGMLYIVVGVEETFNIRFTDVGVNDFITVKDVIDYIEIKLK